MYPPDITVYSDASDSWGSRALRQLKWSNLPWSGQLQTCSIAAKGLVPVVIAVALYGSQWSGRIVTFRVDNTAVVEVFNGTSCRVSYFMHLVYLLVCLASYHNFWFTASHTECKQNTLADTLSRNNILSRDPTGFMTTTLNYGRDGHPVGTESVLDIHRLNLAVQVITQLC